MTFSNDNILSFVPDGSKKIKNFNTEVGTNDWRTVWKLQLFSQPVRYTFHKNTINKNFKNEDSKTLNSKIING